MSFTTSANTITLTAKLTPFGRVQLLENTNSVITNFSLGDSDANYLTNSELSFGQVPSIGGTISYNNIIQNGVSDNILIKNKLLVNGTGISSKKIESIYNKVNINKKKIGVTTLDKTYFDCFKINKLDYETDSLTNLFATFGLPITEIQKNLYTNVTDSNGGFSDTALYGLNQDNVLVLSLKEPNFGEIIDGKVIKIEIINSGNTYEIYSTYQKSLTPLDIQDSKFFEVSPKSNLISKNISFLFSDQIKKPNNNVNKSWSTGFNTTKPFSVNNKELFNIVDNPNQNTFKDDCVGIAYLDKGFIVITNQNIVNDFNFSNYQINFTFDSVINEISQDYTCIINRGEFSISTNPTYSVGDTIRISEIGLYDDSNNLMAIGKTNKQIKLTNNQFLALGISLVI